MKNNLKIIIAAFVFAIAFGWAANGSAQIRVGGYKAISVRDAAVVEAADVAVSAQNAADESIVYELTAVKTAQRQTVQGTNYRLCLQIIAADAESENDYEFARATVYRNLEGDYELKSWTEVKSCGK